MNQKGEKKYDGLKKMAFQFSLLSNCALSDSQPLMFVSIVLTHLLIRETVLSARDRVELSTQIPSNVNIFLVEFFPLVDESLVLILGAPSENGFK